MTATPMMGTSFRARRIAGFSLIEMLVAMALGLVLTYAMATVYLGSKTAFRRNEQQSSLQQNVRTAFEYLTADARSVGLAGCQNGRGSGFASNLGTLGITNNFAVAVEGYDAAAAPAYPLTDVTTVGTGWVTNASPSSAASVMFSTVGSVLTSGSDVLVLRTTAGRGLRLTAATSATTPSVILVEGVSGGVCSNGSTAKLSNFCANSFGLIASCTNARVFSVSSLATVGSATQLTIDGVHSSDPIYSTAASTAPSEVFPLQTVIYYVKESGVGGNKSLYRRVIDGDSNVEQELVEGVESLQVRYGVDTTATPDGTVDDYLSANSVASWASVVSVRMGLVLRPADPVQGDVGVRTSDTVNGVTVTYPTTGPKFDRRVFTTTVALRNRVAF